MTMVVEYRPCMLDGCFVFFYAFEFVRSRASSRRFRLCRMCLLETFHSDIAVALSLFVLF